MARIKHFKRRDVARLGHEWNRDRRADGSLMFRPTGEIDESRTPGNYQMEAGKVANLPNKRLGDFLDKRLGQLTVGKRKDLNVVSCWVVTCPKELQGDPEKVRRFFEVTYGFIQDRYGRENVLGGFVHVDETSPHIHVPIVPAKNGRVSSKAIFTRTELSQFHKDLDETMAREFGQKGLILNGRTKGNYTTEELKERSKQEEALRLEHGNLKRQREYIAQKQAEVDRREQAVAARERAVKAREEAARQLVDSAKALKRALEAHWDKLDETEGKALEEFKTYLKGLKTLAERQKAIQAAPRIKMAKGHRELGPELEALVADLERQEREQAATKREFGYW